MSVYVVTSNDTLTLNGHVMNNLAVDDVTTVTFPNELVTRKTGKNGNTIFAQNAQGLNADVTLRLIRGSADDAFMQNIINTIPADFPSTNLLDGSFVKRLGNGIGGVTSDSYTLSGGVISKQVEGKENVSGDVTQGEAIYTIKFASGTRALG